MGKLRLHDRNTVIMAGRLTRDIELRYVGTGQVPKADFAIANTRYYRDRNDQTQDDTSFIDCEAWRKTAEIAAERLHKGQAVEIEGRLKQERWEDKETGKTRSRLLVQVQRIVPLEWDYDGQQGNGNGNGRGERQTSKPPVQERQPEPAPDEYYEDNIPF